MQVMEPALSPAPVVHPRFSREEIEKKFESLAKDKNIESLSFRQLEELSLKNIYNESQVVHTFFSDQNRYSNAFPNDRHRATLKDGSYLNVSPIYLGEKTYFVGQAPTLYSLYHFVRFLLEPLPEKPKGIQTIVTLTMPQEGNRETCFNYWKGCPLIQILKENISFNQGLVSIVHRTLGILKEGKIEKEINQVCVENWPDGNIISIDILYALIHLVDSLKGGKFIHCSAGLGRSGVFIIAYHALKYMQYDNINENILRCRIQRRGMVQTSEQHRYLVNEVSKLIANLKRESLPQPVNIT